MENQTTTTRVALKWGLIFGVICIVYSAATLIAGQINNQGLGYVTYVIVAIGIYVALNDYKKENLGFITFGEGLGLGTLMSAIIGLISGFFMFAYMKFIDTTISEQMLQKAAKDMERRGTPDDQIEQAMQYSQIFLSPGAIFIFTVFGYLIVGFIISLIIAVIVKKEKTIFE